MQNKTKNTHYRQGDVLIVATSAQLPKTAKEIPMSQMGPILALGEVTGHHHTVVAAPETYKPLVDLPPTWLTPRSTKDLAASAGLSEEDIIEDAIALEQEHSVMTVANYAAERLAEANKLNKLLVGVNTAEPACRLYTTNESGERMLVVTRHTILRHEEHPAIGLAPGNYKVVQQQEFTPEGWQNVQD